MFGPALKKWKKNTRGKIRFVDTRYDDLPSTYVENIILPFDGVVAW